MGETFFEWMNPTPDPSPRREGGDDPTPEDQVRSVKCKMKNEK